MGLIAEYIGDAVPAATRRERLPNLQLNIISDRMDRTGGSRDEDAPGMMAAGRNGRIGDGSVGFTFTLIVKIDINSVATHFRIGRERRCKTGLVHAPVHPFGMSGIGLEVSAKSADLGRIGRLCQATGAGVAVVGVVRFYFR